MLKVKIFLFMTVISRCNGGNILLLSMPIDSHCLEMSGIANELIKRNHSVFAYLPDSFKADRCFGANDGVRIITYEVSTEYLEAKQFTDKGVIESIFRGKGFNLSLTNNFFKMGNLACKCGMKSKKMNLLKKLKIDIAIVDNMAIAECMMYIVKYLKALSVLQGSYIYPIYSGGPPQDHGDPYIYIPCPRKMNLKQRLLNTLFALFSGQLVRILNWYNSFDKSSLNGSIPKDIFEEDSFDLAKKSVLFLENRMDVLDYPKAVYPNFIRVGGLTTRPAQALPRDLDAFFSSAKKGVIVVSFGSMLIKFPSHIFERILSIFRHFEQNVVMTYHINGVYGNVKTVSWLPQNDVLAHKNTVLFVSHCGQNGLNEAFYHGVPVVCTPFHGDQNSNAQKVKELKIGAAIKILYSTNEEIIEVIKEVLNDKLIHDNIKRLSAIYHDDKFTPQEKAANALEHVLKFGGDHLRPASSEFNFISENMIDIWFIIFLCIFLYVYISYRIVKCCCRCVCRKQKLNTKKIKDVKIRNGALN